MVERDLLAEAKQLRTDEERRAWFESLSVEERTEFAEKIQPVFAAVVDIAARWMAAYREWFEQIGSIFLMQFSTWYEDVKKLVGYFHWVDLKSGSKLYGRYDPRRRVLWIKHRGQDIYFDLENIQDQGE